MTEVTETGIDLTPDISAKGGLNVAYAIDRFLDSFNYSHGADMSEQEGVDSGGSRPGASLGDWKFPSLGLTLGLGLPLVGIVIAGIVLLVVMRK